MPRRGRVTPPASAARPEALGPVQQHPGDRAERREARVGGVAGPVAGPDLLHDHGQPEQPEDLDELGELQTVEAELAEMLAEDDVINLAAAMEPGSTAGVLIWENLWAAPFASAARRAGGQLIADGRIPIQAIIASIEADNELAATTEGA